MAKKLFILSIASILGIISNKTTAQIVFSSVGTISGNNASEAAQWHNTSVPKTHDLLGNEIYGTSGFLLFAGGTSTSTYSNGSGPLTFSNIPNGVQTVQSLPTGITFSNGWGGPNWALGGQFYPTINVPTTNNMLGYGGVINVPAWWPTASAFPFTRTAQVFRFTIGASTLGAGNPAGVIRLGIHVFNNSFVPGTGPDLYVALQSVSASSNTANHSLYSANFTHTMHFFDISGYNGGEVIELWLTAANPGDNAYISAISFDIIPEPGTVFVVLLSGLATVLFRNRLKKQSMLSTVFKKS